MRPDAASSTLSGAGAQEGPHRLYDHTAFVHRGPDEFADAMAAPLNEAIEAGDAVLLCLPEDSADEVVDRLDRPEAPTRLALDTRYNRPGVAMHLLSRFCDQALATGASAVWSVGAIPFDGFGGDLRWLRYERAVDDVLGHLPLHAVCSYDTATVGPDLLTRAALAHPTSICLGHEHLPAHAPPDPTPLPRIGGELVQLTDVSTAEVRRRLRDALADEVSAQRMQEVELAVTELVTNGMRHGRPPVTTTVRRADRGVVVEVVDHGPGIRDLLADLRPLRGSSDGGYGLWLVGQLADEVGIAQLDGRTTVTATFAA